MIEKFDIGKLYKLKKYYTSRFPSLRDKIFLLIEVQSKKSKLSSGHIVLLYNNEKRTIFDFDYKIFEEMDPNNDW